MMSFRTDRNNNPTAFITRLADLAGLVQGKDYEIGDPFTTIVGGHEIVLHTAKLLGDPIALTIQVMDKTGFETSLGRPRWNYVDLLKEHWDSFTPVLKKSFIGLMYKHEGGTALQHLFDK